MDMFPGLPIPTAESWAKAKAEHAAECRAHSEAWGKYVKLLDQVSEAQKRAKRVVERVAANERPTARGALEHELRRRLFKRINERNPVG